MTAENEALDAETIEKAACALFEEGHSDLEWSWSDVVREEGSRADIWREDASRVLIASGLLDRLRATEAELAVCRDLTEAWRGNAAHNRREFEAMRATATAAEARVAELESEAGA